MGWYDYEPRPTVAQRRATAEAEIRRREASGETLSPVRLEGNKLGRTFWGKAWCDQIAHFSDYASRLPSGKSYVRHGAVIDLRIDPGRVRGKVVGSSVYTIDVRIATLDPEKWDAIKREIGGQIKSVVELLQGRFSDGVMSIVTRPTDGLLPTLGEVKKSCTCLDWADLCKHLAAVLYGVGVRLDYQPELLFTLRGVDPAELISQVAAEPVNTKKSSNRRTLAPSTLGAVFGIELESESYADPEARAPNVGDPGKPAAKRKHNPKPKTKPRAKRLPKK